MGNIAYFIYLNYLVHNIIYLNTALLLIGLDRGVMSKGVVRLGGRWVGSCARWMKPPFPPRKSSMRTPRNVAPVSGHTRPNDPWRSSRSSAVLPPQGGSTGPGAWRGGNARNPGLFCFGRRKGGEGLVTRDPSARRKGHPLFTLCANFYMLNTSFANDLHRAPFVG